MAACRPVTVLVLGSTGQLARHLRERWPEAAFWGHDRLDLSHPERIRERVLSLRPRAIVNAAAYTAVDRAETESDLAWRLNAEAPAALARAAQTLEIPLVHVSTDYVFDGRADRPYVETDPVAPLNVYGRGKLGGELAVATLCTRHWILRTSWVFSEHGSNFVRTMLRLARERDTLRVVNDQFGRPTYAGDLARLIDRIVSAPESSRPLPWGLHHATGGPELTWHAFASTIVERAQARGLIARRPEVIGVSTQDYAAALATPGATRPSRATLQPSRYLETLPGAFDWDAGLDAVLARTASPTPTGVGLPVA